MLEDRIAAGQAVGLSAAVFDGTAERFVSAGARQSGKADMVNADTVFEVGSISKVFTSVLLAHMVTQGRLSLDTKVSDLVPAGVKVPQLGREMTLRDLATHTSGLPRVPPGFSASLAPNNPYAAFTVDDLWAGLARAQLSSPPGTRSDYSNMGFMLLSHILVTAAGKASYEELVTERILRPLGMTASGVNIANANTAAAHGTRGESVPWWDFPPTMGGVGAIRSSARDMLKFTRANLAADSGHDALAKALSLTQQTHWTGDPGSNPATMGLAWQIRKTKSGKTLLWHNGGTGGSRSFIGFDKASGEVVVLLGNSPLDLTTLGFHLLDPASSPLPPVKRTVVLEPELLDKLAGEYTQQGSDKPSLWIMRAGDRLLVRTESGQPQPLETESATRLSTPNNSIVAERVGATSPVQLSVTLAPGEAPKHFGRREEKTAVTLAQAQLRPLEGTYRLASGQEFVVKLEGEALTLSVAGSRAFKLDALSPVEFVAKQLNASVAFVREGEQPAGELHWTQLGSTAVAKRAN